MPISTFARIALTAAILVVPALALAGQKAPTSPPARGGPIQAGGVNYYYEVHGQGEPLLLLHGGLGSIDMFRPVLPQLAAHRTVIAVDLQGHGRTPLGDRPFGLPAMGNDMDTVLQQLGIGAVDVLGYSMGSGVAFQLAVQHPERVRRLVMVSAVFARDGYYPEMLEAQAKVGAPMVEFMKDTPMYRSYVAVAPRPEDFSRLLDVMGTLMRTPYDWSADVPKLKMPVMLVYGDSDMMRPEHVMRFYQLLGGGLRDAGWQREHMAQNRLAILPGLTHYDIFLAPELMATVLPFLDGKVRTANWSDQAGK